MATSGFDAFQLYLALKLHFTTDYDFFTYNGKVSANPSSYEVRRDKLWFDKLSRHVDPKGLLVSSFIVDPQTWIKNLSYSPKVEKRWEEWSRRVQALTYVVGEELRRLGPGLLSTGTGHPRLLREYLAKRVSLETVVAVLDSTESLRVWDAAMTDDPVWAETRRLVLKYRPFLNFNREKIKALVDAIDNDAEV